MQPPEVQPAHPHADTVRRVTFAAGYSRSAVDRAGVVLRRFWEGSGAVTPEEVDAFTAMIAFRETFQDPLRKTATGLRSMVKSEVPRYKAAEAPVPVVQRLKRREQILNKLSRFPESKLSNMGDIGGCRVILDDRDQVDRVRRRIERTWQVHGRIRDTRDEPAPSGYRALHIIVVRDRRKIEIQLRTPDEHEWAVVVERTGARLGIGLKEGEGPDDLKEYFRLASRGLYLEKKGIVPDEAFLQAFNASREQVRPYFSAAR